MTTKRPTQRGRITGYHPRLFKAFLISKGFDPPATFAETIGLTRSTFIHKLSGDSPWSRQQMLRIKTFFKMNNDEFCNIFMDTSDEYIRKVREQY